MPNVSRADGHNRMASSSIRYNTSETLINEMGSSRSPPWKKEKNSPFLFCWRCCYCCRITLHSAESFGIQEPDDTMIYSLYVCVCMWVYNIYSTYIQQDIYVVTPEPRGAGNSFYTHTHTNVCGVETIRERRAMEICWCPALFCSFYFSLVQFG